MTPSATHLVILPTYNTGPRLRDVVVEVLQHWQPVLVVVDGSTDGSEQPLLDLPEAGSALSVLVLPRNAGKGAAVLAGAQAAQARGFSHALVMDADGQHPAASIAEFMHASRRDASSMILGRPIFPANIPAERLHGRKLSVGLVHLEMLGSAIADPLFGFRVYPLAPLLAVLGPRRSGRRYDFDTEAAVRLGWAGVPAHNLAAPVRYFSRAEGGVSHFRYLRDNVTLFALHTRLLAELLLWRWPAVLRHRRQWRHWRAAGLTLTMFMLCALPLPAAEADPLVNAAHRIDPTAAAWTDLAAAFARQPDITADFTEHRFFPFRNSSVALQGEVRVSSAHGLSLHYTQPEERLVILDTQGMLIRTGRDETAPPVDRDATASTQALLRVLRFDLAALQSDFELYGRRDAATWVLTLVPRRPALQRSVGRITVNGEAATIRNITIRRSAKQAIEIMIAPPRPTGAFTADELKKFFR